MTTKPDDKSGQQTLAEQRAQEHVAQDPKDVPHSRGEQRDTDGQSHPAPQDQNQQLGREGVRQQMTPRGRHSK